MSSLLLKITWDLTHIKSSLSNGNWCDTQKHRHVWKMLCKENEQWLVTL